MIIISHRGNLRGINESMENRPSYIDSALQLGFHVEVDVRYENNHFYLGHDLPQYIINDNWILSRKNKLWFHCKDLLSAVKLKMMDDTIKFFCHKNDDYVLTSDKKFWVHDLTLDIDENCIIPLLNSEDVKKNVGLRPYGICTDYVYELIDCFNLSSKDL